MSQDPPAYSYMNVEFEAMKQANKSNGVRLLSKPIVRLLTLFERLLIP